MSKEVMIVTGAGQISMAITRRIGYGKKIVMGDKKLENAQEIAKVMNDAGFDVEPMKMDLSSRESILNLIAKAKEYGEIKMLVNGGYRIKVLNTINFKKSMHYNRATCSLLKRWRTALFQSVL
jgi:NAD(P)-dependent dehydrogenase (short-subunit alcohol dehydrogenase family)